jgi:hypothetical protein
MDSESLKVSADVCEEHGSNHAAKLLRELSDDKATAYLVVEKSSDYNDEIYFVDGGEPQKLFLDRKEAIAYAELENARRYKTINPFHYGYALSEVTDLSMAELTSRIRKIMGNDSFGLPDEDDMWADDSPVFARKTTDEQMIKIAKLFKIKFFEVIKTKISV